MSNHLFEHLAAYALSMHAEGVKTATKYMLPSMTVRLTRIGKGRDRRVKRVHLTLSVGSPNYTERQFIKDCKKAGEKFPVRKIQLRHAAKKR